MVAAGSGLVVHSLELPAARTPAIDFEAALGDKVGNRQYENTPLDYNEYTAAVDYAQVPLFETGTDYQEVLRKVRQRNFPVVSKSKTHITVVDRSYSYGDSALDFGTYVYGFDNTGLVFGPMNASSYWNQYELGGHTNELQALFELYVKDNVQSARPHNAFAWRMATSDSEELRDPEYAIELALEGNRLTNYSAPNLLDTLAAAYAAGADYDNAVKYQTMAVERLDDENEDVAYRLELYKKEQAFVTTPHNLKNVPEHIAQPALAGDPDGMHELAHFCDNNDTIAFGYSAWEWLEKAAERGQVAAQKDLGYAYRYGKFDLEVSESAAWLWLQQAHDDGSKNGSRYLALMYADAASAYHDEEKATQTMEIAVARGVDYLTYELAARYRAGLGVQRNLVRARELLAEYEKNDLRAVDYVVNEPLLAESDLSSQLKLLKKPKNLMKQKLLARELLRLGKDYLAAKTDPGDEWGYDDIKWFNEELWRRNTESMPSEGFQLVHLAARLGDRQAQELVANLYADGVGVRASQKAAKYWADRIAQ